MSFARVIGVSAVFTFSANRAINQMTRASRGFDRLNTSAKSTQDTLRQGFAGLTGLGVAATAGIGFAVSKFADFDKAAMQLKSRLDASDPSFETMKQKALEVGGATKFTAAEVLTAMERFKQLGVSGKDVLTNIGMVAKFAASENISLEKAVRMGVVSTKVFGLETSKLSDVMNRMMFVSNNTAANTTELFNALRYVSGATKFTKSNFQEIVNMLGLFHNSALFGSRAGTAMTNMINKLSANAKQGTIQIGDYTAMIHKNKEGGLDLTQTMLNVATAFKRMTEDAKKSGKGMETVQRLADKLFGVRGARGVGALVDFVYGKDRDTLLKLYKTQENQVNKEIDKVYNIRVKNVKDAYVRMTSAVDAFAISSIRAFKPQIYAFIENLSKGITDAGRVVGYLNQSFWNMLKPAQMIKAELGGKGFGMSEKTIGIIQGFYLGFMSVVGAAKMLGSAILFVFDMVTEVTGVFGLGKKELATIGGMLVGAGVVAAGLAAAKFAIGLLLVPIYKVGIGIAGWVFQLGLATFGLNGLAIAGKALGLAFKGIKIAAMLYAAYSVGRAFGKLLDYITSGQMTKWGQQLGSLLAGWEKLRNIAASMGLITETATNSRSGAGFAAQQTLAPLESMRARGMQTIGNAKGERVALSREEATARVRASLKNRKYSESEIEATMKQLLPQLMRFTAKQDMALAGPAFITGKEGPVKFEFKIGVAEVAKQVATYQNNTQERSGKKVDRSMQQRGISQTRR